MKNHLQNHGTTVTKAVALSYKPAVDSAPRVVAKGKGRTAQVIIKLAQDHGIPIQKDPSLVELLSQLEISATIPEELFQAVAEVFAFLYRVDQTLISSK